MYFKDLSVCDYFPVSDPTALRAVGWLGPELEVRTTERDLSIDFFSTIVFALRTSSVPALRLPWISRL